jgi:acyl dehydratase
MLDDITSPLDLQDATLGPVAVSVTADRIAFYVEVTGDVGDRWVSEAPPGFASVLLFAVADLFLHHPRVVPFTATLLHVDQSFTYLAPIRAGSTITMGGTITRVRERAGSYFVTFDADGRDGPEVVLTSTSTFVLSDQQAPAPEVEFTEPGARVRAGDSGPERSASRHDLVRYAAATRDFNPLHWDHGTAVDAGLPGTVVHGLLMYAWMMQEVAAACDGAPIAAAKVRFRSALHPGQQASIAVDPHQGGASVSLTRDGVPLVTGSATVAPAQE